MTPPYLLASHVYVCFTEDYVVLQDLKKDKYLAVPCEAFFSLRSLLAGLDRVSGFETFDSRSDSSELLKELCGQGLLTTDRRMGRDVAPVEMPAAKRQLIPALRPDAILCDLPSNVPPIGSLDVAKVSAACVRATFMLRTMPILKIVRRFERRRMHNPESAPAASPSALVAKFKVTATALFTTKDKCLWESIALLEFLAVHRHFPRFVMGVRTGPFSAHSWVQCDDVVYNDSPEHVRGYRPILAA
jgi:hypothetical protein